MASNARETAAAFDELLAAITTARDEYVESAARAFDATEVVEGYRYLLHLLSEGSELFGECDPQRPRFSLIVSPARKFLGDNPDAIYHQALIRGDRSYRIRGVKDTQTYLSFTVHAAGGFGGAVQADVNDRDLDIAPDGSYEIVLSAHERPGNWIPLQPDSGMVIVRSYYQDAQSVQTDPDAFVRIGIEALDEPGPAPPLDDATYAARLRELASYVRASTVDLRMFGARSPVPFVADEPNTVGPPWSFRNAEVAGVGAVDIFYSSGTFELGPDDALVMEGVLPPCAFVNVMLWNVHMQTLDYMSHRSSLNGAQIVTGADGRYRIVIAARDPGVANWLDPGGARRGTIFWRFLLPESDPPQPSCRVVPVAEVRAAGGD